MGDPAVSEEVRQGVRELGTPSKQVKPPRITSKASRQAAKYEECTNNAQSSSSEPPHLATPALSQAKGPKGSLCLTDSPAGAETAAAARVRGAPGVLADGFAADTLSYFTLAESKDGSSFYFLGTRQAEDTIASSPSIFLWNPSEACVHEVDAGLGTCRHVYRLPAEIPLIPGVGGCCCCVSAATSASQPHPSRHRQNTKKRKEKEQAPQSEKIKEAVTMHASSSSWRRGKRNNEKHSAPETAEETQPRLRFILADDCRLWQFSSVEATRHKEQGNGDKGETEAEDGEARSGNATMEQILQEANSLSLGGIIYAVYALPSSSAPGTPWKLSPSLCLVVHAPPLSREEPQKLEEQQQKNKQQRDLLEQGEKKKLQKRAAASAGQQEQRLNELHFTVVCCSSLKALSTCALPFHFPVSSVAVAAEAAAGSENSRGVPSEDGKRSLAETRKEAVAVRRQRIEKIYLTGTVVRKQQHHQNVIRLQVIVQLSTVSDTGEAGLDSSNVGKAHREFQRDSCSGRVDAGLHVDVCLQAALEVTVEMKEESRENTGGHGRAAAGSGSTTAAAACAADGTAERVSIICRTNFSRLGEENVHIECSTDREPLSPNDGDSKRRRVSSDNSNCNSSNSNRRNDTSCSEEEGSRGDIIRHSRGRTRGRTFVSCFPDWSPPMSLPAAGTDGSVPSPLLMMSQQHNGEFQLFSLETSTGQLLLSKRYRSLLFPERSCHVRGATVLSNRCFLEWVRGDETETGCLLLLRELMWGTPCSPVYRLDCSRYFNEPPVLLGSASDRRAAATVALDLLWRGSGAVFAIPLLRPLVSHRRILGACAGFPLSAALAAGSKHTVAAAIRNKMKQDHTLLLRAAGVGNEGRAAEVAAALLSLTSPRFQQSQLPFDEAWTSSEEERRETEKAICSALKEGMVAIPSALVSYIIEHAMHHAAVQCCNSPLIQSLQQALASGDSGAAAAVLEILQLLSAWLKHYCSLEDSLLQVEEHRKEAPSAAAAKMNKRILCAGTAPATAGNEPDPSHQDIPPLQLILDFTAILVGARLQEIIMGCLFKDEASSGEMQEKKLFLKVLKRVQQLLEAADGKALRRVEGRIFAALSAQLHSAEDGDANRELVEAFKVAL